MQLFTHIYQLKLIPPTGSVNSITASVNVFFGNPEYKYSEAELAEYTLMMKRAFKNGTYFINCDYGSAGVQVGDYHKKIGYDAIMTSYH